MRNRVLIGLALVTAALAVVLFIVPAATCPSVAAVESYRAAEASRVYAADGSLIADLSPQRRVIVDLEDIPEAVREGILAVEDRRFREHGGVDPRGVARAVWRNLTSLSLREGFSTITMQLARNLFPEELPRTEMLGRKICEIHLARRIEDEFDKNTILELYLNQIYLGSGMYGVEAAAQGYFGKSIREVTPVEAALLVGLPKSPEGYNPRKHPLEAIRRRNIVLDVMQREGVLSAERVVAARAAPLDLAPPPEAAGPAPYFVAAVRQELRERFGADAYIRGLRVYTGLEPALQKSAHDALVAQIDRIESGAFGSYRHPTPESDPDAPSNGASPYLQGMITVLDPETGAVRAMVGGRDFEQSQYNRALQAQRQPGSAFKPIVYAAAIRQRLPLTERIETGPVAIDGEDGRLWRPGDHLPDSVTALPLRDALAVSSNHAAVRVGRWVGEDRVQAMARSLGLSTPIPDYPSIHLGAAEVIPAELVAAYAAFENGGSRVPPRLITRIEDDEGRVLWKAPETAERVLSEGEAFLMLSMLEDVVDRGTGTAVRRGGFDLPAAGKTGTTNDGKDVWFIGMTPDLVAGVWLGLDQPRPIVPGASGGRLAAPVWARVMGEAYEDRPAPADWTPPDTLLRVEVDTASGERATGNCPPDAIRAEYFLPGTDPATSCSLHPQSGVERTLERVWGGIRRLFGGPDTTES